MTEEKRIVSQEHLNKALSDAGVNVEIGDIFMDDRGYYYRVTGFTYYHHTPNEHELVQVVLEPINANEGYGTCTPTLKDLEKYVKIHTSIEELEQDAMDSFLRGSLLDEPEELAPNASETALMTHSQDALKQARDATQMMHDRSEAIKRVIEKRVRHMMAVQSEMRKKLTFMDHILKMLEGYLGVYENIVQLQQGIPAAENVKLTVRQLVLYMDEEVGDVEFKNRQLGIDYQRIDDFDAWLLTDDNYKYILPEEKCVVALKSTRQWRKYSDNPFANAAENENNRMTYLAIRNGENLYRVWVGFNLGDRLFPTVELFQELQEGIVSKYRSGFDDNVRVHRDEDVAKLQMVDWQRNALIIEGLIHRTDVFKPHHADLSIVNETAYELELVQIIRDAETPLSDGHKTYRTWRDEVNSMIDIGSRVYVGPFHSSHWSADRKEYSDRFALPYRNWYPHFPHEGVYTIVDVREKHGTTRHIVSGTNPSNYVYEEREYVKRSFKILYMPDDDVWNWDSGYHDRKRRVGFWLKPEDDNVLNYDAINLDDVMFYINHRLERIHYQDMLPVLKAIYMARKEEIKAEADFVKLIVNEGYTEEIVWEAVEWWKTKNKWKRPIAQDDSKAWRMIRKKLQK